MLHFFNVEDIKKGLSYVYAYNKWFEFKILNNDVGDVVVDKQVD